MTHYAGYKCFAGAICTLILTAGSGLAQQTPTIAQALKSSFDGINKQVLDMVEDFPAEKYDFRLKPEMRSFGEVIVHIASGNVYLAKAGRGEKVKWDELDPKNYKTKAEIVALFRKSVEDADTTLKANPEGYGRNIAPWIGVIEHSGEHYGLLVAYYRANGMVPPESRPKSK
jgi:DinB family protein